MTDDRKDDDRRTPSWQLPQERQPDTSAYHIWTPRPLLRSIYWKPVPPPPFEVVSAAYEVFLEQRAWLTMHEHVWQAPANRTPFGYLVGDLCEDPNANRKFVIVTSALPARFAFHEDRKEQISREAILALQLEVERRRGVLVGWYHRHIGGAVALTEADIRTHHQHFSEPWQCAFVFTGGGDRSDGGCFRSTPDSFAGDLQLPFYEMASNESLLARGLKRSYVDWSNYSTVDEIRSEPLSRPLLPSPEGQGPGAEPTPGAERAPAAGTTPAPVQESPPPVPAPPPPVPPVPAGAAVPESDRETEGKVKPARIEFDSADTAATRKSPPPPPVPAARKPGTGKGFSTRITPDATLDQVARELETDAGSAPVGRGLSTSRFRLPADPKRLWMLGGAVLLAAILVGGLLTVTGRDADPAAGGPAAPARTEGGAATTGATPERTGEPTAADSLVTLADLENESRAVLATISSFYGRAVERDDGRATCEDLRAAFVAVEDHWIRYSTEFKARYEGRLPEDLALRDERLYAGVQDTEREFDRSGCPRP